MPVAAVWWLYLEPPKVDTYKLNNRLYVLLWLIKLKNSVSAPKDFASDRTDKMTTLSVEVQDDEYETVLVF